MIDIAPAPVHTLKTTKRQMAENLGQRLLRRLRLLDILVTPRQALYLATFERTLVHRTAMDRTGVFVEEHLTWLRDDEDYAMAYRHVLMLNQVHAMDTAISHAIHGISTAGKKPSHQLMGQLIDMLRGRSTDLPSLLPGAAPLSMVSPAGSGAATGTDNAVGATVVELPAEDETP